MTSVLGTAALAAGLLAAIAATVGWSRTALGRAPARAARRATLTVLVCAAAACAVLEWALVTRDFSVRFVADHGGRDVPLYYTVTSLWGALEGSLLLWLLVLAGCAAVLARRGASGPLHAWALATTCAVSVFFFGLALLGGNPFGPVRPVPADGPGPNPLLQDHPAMGLHPPLLYLGYVGLVVPFAYAVAALVTGDTGRGWLRAARPWALFSWAALTAGIVLGAWWSYAVLGWGGYWAWDPVENASLLPWLTTTALLHGALVQERRGALRLWNLTLAAGSFLLVLLGTFLTRSGVVTSVHAFSQSPLGPALLTFFVLVLGLVAGLLVWRADRLGPAERVAAVTSRESALLGNNLLLAALAFTVLLGTLYPLATEALVGERTAVGAPYFDRMAVPVALLLLLLMAVGPLVAWGQDAPRRVGGRLPVPVLAGSLALAGAAALGARDPLALLAYGLAGAAGATTLLRLAAGAGLRGGGARSAAKRLVRRRQLLGGALAHAGLVVVAVAVTASGTADRVVQRDVALGDRIVLDDVVVELTAVERGRTDDRMTTRADLRVQEGDRDARRVRPDLTLYVQHAMVVSRPAVLTGLRRDVYVSVLAVREDAAGATVRVAVNPLMGWLWAGGGLMALGGLVGVVPSRRPRRGGGGAPPGSAGTVATVPGPAPTSSEPAPVPARLP